MQLPKIKTPEYVIELPISKQKVTYRPFLVREEKMFMMLKEAKDQNLLVNNLKKIVEQCIIDGPNIDDISYNDFEILFLSMRVRSMGESVDLSLKCKSCGKQSPVSINLDDVCETTKKTDIGEAKIMLNEEVGVICTPIKMSRMGQAASLTEKDTVNSVAFFIDKVFTKDQVYTFSEMPFSEQKAFVDSLSMKHITEITQYAEKLPTASCEVNYTCASCGAQNDQIVKGLENFFT